jgi:hypothetical protein
MSSRRVIPWPRQPTTTTSAPKRFASANRPSAGAVNDNDVSVWPSSRQGAAGGASRHIGGLIERRQQYRSLMLSLDASRDDRPHAGRFAPREQHGGRHGAPSLDGTITRNQDAECLSRQLRHLVAILLCGRLTLES